MQRRRLLSRLPAALAVVSAALFWSPAGSAGGEPIAIIVNKGNPVGSLNKSSLRPIFETKKTTWGGGGKILALNLPSGNGARVDFDRAVLGMSPDRVAQYWTDRKIRGGSRPPKRIPSPALVARVVGAKADAIGYVPKSAVGGNVKVVGWIKGGSVTGP